MNKYWEYFKYVIEHKKNVFLECRKVKGMFWHGVFHDMSKFSPKEFKAYAINFYGDRTCYDCRHRVSDEEFDITGVYNPCTIRGCYALQYNKYEYKDFDKAWEHHYKHNKHHWDHWVGRDMPKKYIEQMICDWNAMSVKFGGSAQQYYIENYHKFKMTNKTREDVEYLLCINDSGIHNYGRTLYEFTRMYDEKTFNSKFGFIESEFGVDAYKAINKEV